MNTRQFYEWIGRPRGILSLLTPMSHEINGAESLTSYLLRNQLALGVRINELMDHASLLLEAEEERVFKQGFYYARSFPMSLNGNSQSTGLLTKALQILKPDYDFEALTIKSYEQQTNGLWMMPKFKKSIAWCGHCLREWQEGSSLIHYPLRWQLQGYHSCEVHNVPLSQVCMSCGAQHKQFNHHLMVGKCNRCKSDLTTKKTHIVVGQEELF